MSFTDNQIQDVVEQWLGAWWKSAAPVHNIVQSPVFAAYLQDSRDVFLKAQSYWQEHPDDFQARISDCALQFQHLFSNMDVDLLENAELITGILDAQKLIAKNLVQIISDTQGLTERESSLLRFNLRQLMAFADPRNSVCANPDMLQTLFKTQGQSLLSGSQQYRHDMEESSFGLNIQRSELGGNCFGKSFACSPGSVIFQNELMQIIHYRARTDKQHRTPLLIVPPCINRFYVLDLLPENSFVRWLGEQQHDVYMISWINPDARLATTTFDDYIDKGCLEAIRVVADFAEVERINLMGYCIGGLMAAIASSTQQGRSRVASLSLLATLLDYSSPGELGVFISPAIMDALRQDTTAKGVLESESMSLAFCLLREEQLLWKYVRKKYYLGKPVSFDALMHWGQDATNLAGQMAIDYLENFYQNNCLLDEVSYQYGSESVSLINNGLPKYMLACDSDHIAPAASVMSSAKLMGGDIRLVTGQGGHVQGVINHPFENRGGFIARDLTGADVKTDESSSKRSNLKGSWWKDWNKWVKPYTGSKIEPRPTASGRYPQIETAPGSYAES